MRIKSPIEMLFEDNRNLNDEQFFQILLQEFENNETELEGYLTRSYEHCHKIMKEIKEYEGDFSGDEYLMAKERTLKEADKIFLDSNADLIQKTAIARKLYDIF